MTSKTLRRTLVGALIAGGLVGTAASTALAQDHLGSAVTIGGGVAGVGGGDTVVLAPGVTISGGDVTNTTGIGIDSGGGSSIGATAGGNESAAVAE